MRRAVPLSPRRFTNPADARPLTQGEQVIWQKVAKTIDPLNDHEQKQLTQKQDFERAMQENGGVDSQPRFADVPAHNTEGVDYTPLIEKGIGSRARTRPSQSGDMRMDFLAGLDRRMAQRVKRGKLEPDARIDLHGDFADPARARLNAFVQRCHRSNMKLILVVTGKGGYWREGPEGPRQTGVIRRSLPDWLAAPTLRPMIRNITPAHQRHGGTGAFYIFLKTKDSRYR